MFTQKKVNIITLNALMKLLKLESTDKKEDGLRPAIFYLFFQIWPFCVACVVTFLSDYL